MKIWLLLTYYKRLLRRSSKPYFYFCLSFIIHLLLIGFLIFFQFINRPYFYFYELLVTSLLFQFFYNHLYFGLGWESSFRYFILFQMKVKNIILLYISLNFFYFIYSFLLIKIVALTGWLSLDYDFLNLIIVYLLIPNTLFVFVFPLLTIYINLFDPKGGLVIHKYYAFPLFLLVIVIPSVFQYLILNYYYGSILTYTLGISLLFLVIVMFPKVIKFWEVNLMKIESE